MTKRIKPSLSVTVVIVSVSCFVMGCALLGPNEARGEEVYGYQPLGVVYDAGLMSVALPMNAGLSGVSLGVSAAGREVGTASTTSTASTIAPTKTSTAASSASSTSSTSSTSLPVPAPDAIVPLDPLDPLDPSAPRVPGDPMQVAMLKPDVALPYPLDNVISTFGECRGVKKIHRGLDIGGVGPDLGLGTPVRSMTKGTILAMGTPDDDPRRYGRWDTREGLTKRRGIELPRSREIPGYGMVRFFTRDRGWSKMGVYIEIVVQGGVLDGYHIRYMHLGALHPSLKPGATVEAGQEIGLMGGTAILSSLPHVHLDMDSPTGRRVDIAPYVGLHRDRRGPKRCKGRGEP